MKLFLGIAILLSVNLCYAQDYTSVGGIHPIEYDVSDVVTEIGLLRPLGFLGSIAGTAVFLGTLPLSLFASIAPPHDVIDKAANTLIIGPANATFKRPFAYYHYDPIGRYPEIIKH